LTFDIILLQKTKEMYVLLSLNFECITLSFIALIFFIFLFEYISREKSRSTNQTSDFRKRIEASFYVCSYTLFGSLNSIALCRLFCVENQGWNSQNFLSKFIRFFITLGLKILRLLRLKVVLKHLLLKGDINYCNNHKLPIFHG